MMASLTAQKIRSTHMRSPPLGKDRHIDSVRRTNTFLCQCTDWQRLQVARSSEVWEATRRRKNTYRQGTRGSWAESGPASMTRSTGPFVRCCRSRFLAEYKSLHRGTSQQHRRTRNWDSHNATGHSCCSQCSRIAAGTDKRQIARPWRRFRL